jgi:uncharacterized protein YrrD
MMKYGEVKNMAVVSVAGAGKLGFIDDMLFDATGQRVLGFRVRRGGLVTHHEALLLADIKAIGQDAITVEDASRLNSQSKFADFAEARTGSALFGSRMMTENGGELGTISDVDVDFTTGEIQRYMLGGSMMDRLRKQEHSVPSTAVKSIGDKLVVVSNEAAVS